MEVEGVDGDLPPDALPPASQRVLLDSEELAGEVFQHILSLRTRAEVRAVCHCLRRLFERPEHWHALNLGKQLMTTSAESPGRRWFDDGWSADGDAGIILGAVRCFPRGMVESLVVNLQVSALLSFLANDSQLDLIDSSLHFPCLLELDISSSVVTLQLLYAAFKHVGGTLQRLNITSVRYHRTPTIGPRPSDPDTRLGQIGELSPPDFGADFFQPLHGLKVLIASDADHVMQPGDNESTISQGLLSVVQKCCPALEELVLGWRAEFLEKRGGPDAEVEFAPPMWCQPRLVEGALPCLRVLSLPGYVAFAPA